jgi:hypothetical protein
MKLRWLVGLIAVVALTGACSSSSSTGSCDSSLDCDQAFVCREGKCAQQECATTGDCAPESGEQEFCLLGADPSQKDKKFCTAVQCSKDEDCGEGEYCNDFNYCAPGAQPECVTALDCPQAFVCVDSACAQVPCEDETVVCPGEVEGQTFCAPPGVDAADLESKFCSPVACETDEECGEGMVCNEFKSCVAGVIDTEDIVEEDVPVVVEGEACSPCNSDSDCSDYKCYPLGGGTFCFGNCETHDECPTGWMCYALSNEGKQCIPMAFNCEGDCLAAGCPAGQACNQESGACVDAGGECTACQQDWDCMEGYRCYQDQKYCAPVCPDDACPANGACTEANAIPVKLCVSSTVPCCYGDTCTGPSCEGDTPYPCNEAGGCCQCTSDAHCADGEKCEGNVCVSQQCADPTKPYFCNGECKGCCTSAHCADLGAEFVCNNGVCSGDIPPECSYCQDPYPACTQINGIWSCVQCTDDSYCAPGTCDLALYSCSNGGQPGEGCTSCSSDAECMSSLGAVLACDAGSGCCYDTGGFCDGVESYCNEPAGSECTGLMDLLGGGMGIPGMPMPEGMAAGICSCSTPADMMSLITCLIGMCPESPDCLGGSICVDPATVPILGDMLGMLGPVCINPSALSGLLPI